jgi:RNA polymerase sigma-54 factor
VARDELREAVRGVIAAEDSRSPLSDDDVALALRRRGTAIARRTIAKYRDELGIPCSYRRRRFE